MESQQIAPGMVVNDAAGEHVGKVKEMLGNTVHVDCRLAPDYYIPRQYLRVQPDGSVQLKVSSRQAAYMGWELRPRS